MGKMIIDMDEKMHRRLKIYCLGQNISMHSFIKDSIKVLLEIMEGGLELKKIKKKKGKKN